MKLNYTLFIGILLLTISNNSYAQKELREALPYKNKITIKKEDGSFQVAELGNKEEVEKAQTDKHYYWYHADSIRHTQGAYKGKVLHGTYQELYPDKSLKVMGVFYRGLKSGQWRYMEPNGVLRRVSTWYLGEENGPYELYTEQGMLKEKGRLLRGLKEGVIVQYAPQDSVKKTFTKYKHNEALTEEKVSWFDKVKLSLGF